MNYRSQLAVGMLVPVVCLLFPLLSASPVSSAFQISQPGPIPGSEDVVDLFYRSALVCKGLVLDVTQTGQRLEIRSEHPEMVTTAVAVFRPDRVFKGVTSGGPFRIVFALSHSGIETPTLVKGEYALVFVNPADGGYKLADRFFGKLPISARVLQLPEGLTKPIQLLEADIVSSLASERRTTQLAEIELLGGMKRLTSTEPLKKLLSGADDELRG